MDIGERICELRKKAGWSQEELAIKLEVTRQSVSKWESGQSTPDLERIVALSRLFGISTDALLLDAPLGDGPPPLRRLGLTEAQEYVELRRRNTPQLALATLACITCPVPLLLLGIAEESGRISENTTIIGIIVLLIMIAWAVSRFIGCSGALRHLQHLEREEFAADAAVISYAEQLLKDEKDRITRGEKLGTSLCILCPLPLLAALLFDAPEQVSALGVCLLLVLVGLGVMQFIDAGEREEAPQALLQSGDYTPQRKQEQPAMESFSGAYWLVITAIFLLLGFRTNLWRDAAIVAWPLGGLLFVPCRMLFRGLLRRLRK